MNQAEVLETADSSQEDNLEETQDPRQDREDPRQGTPPDEDREDPREDPRKDTTRQGTPEGETPEEGTRTKAHKRKTADGKPVYASGILPISFVNGRCVFLVGEDIRGGYSDFGGKAERFDASSEECASREFFEETLGLTVSAKEIQNRLATNAVQVEGLTANSFKYIMFLTEIPFEKSLQRYMHRCIAFLKSRGLHRLHVEKKGVKWMTLDELMACDKRKVFENTLMQNREVIDRVGRSTPSEFKEMCRKKNIFAHTSAHHGEERHPTR
jgi:8-oxo-dGTP pyrophosphatase MutT (NUDIX family)